MATAKDRPPNARSQARAARRWLPIALMIVILGPLAACSGPAPAPTATAPPLASELVFYDWAEDMPQSILEAFTAEYGVKVSYLTYQSQEEALENMRSSQVYDMAGIENEYIPPLG